MLTTFYVLPLLILYFWLDYLYRLYPYCIVLASTILKQTTFRPTDFSTCRFFLLVNLQWCKFCFVRLGSSFNFIQLIDLIHFQSNSLIHSNVLKLFDSSLNLNWFLHMLLCVNNVSIKACFGLQLKCDLHASLSVTDESESDWMAWKVWSEKPKMDRI